MHPKFVTALLDDLFGLQTRAGCACAGPYGHRLLGIDGDLSDRYRSLIKKGVNSIKPGWCRLGFHYSMDDVETDMMIKAIEFVADHGEHFMADYNFDSESGLWAHKQAKDISTELSLMDAWMQDSEEYKPLSLGARMTAYDAYFDHALTLAKSASSRNDNLDVKLDGELGELQFFALSPKTSVA